MWASRQDFPVQLTVTLFTVCAFWSAEARYEGITCGTHQQTSFPNPASDHHHQPDLISTKKYAQLHRLFKPFALYTIILEGKSFDQTSKEEPEPKSESILTEHTIRKNLFHPLCRGYDLCGIKYFCIGSKWKTAHRRRPSSTRARMGRNLLLLLRVRSYRQTGQNPDQHILPI